ncbi:hypothetical protein CMQ_7042 [Grosmannia clavigera kw1407]|uniref:Uncharacterized protein n=1 Tax=Grosmannia clavigera (strain kw1407 / UAMH 11150) TaxID=655863 RepID=F0XNX6_GROCL|nr:uncharacterized protein CMQ_7042 [Grosmannia clavigera kw1407]EFX00040.1 hypothetical protein CMQ_7042 [Grosmannia clavigera kw1407]
MATQERNSYDALQDSGEAENLDVSGDNISGVLPVHETALRSAVEALESSTEAISKQTDMIQHQLDAVARLVKTVGQANESRSKFEARHMRQWEFRRNNLRVGVEQLSRRLSDHVPEVEQQAKGTQGYAQQMVDGLCRLDDKLLVSLQKLGWALAAPDDADEQQTISQLRDICLRLIKNTVESIRTKLDRIYLEAIEAASEARSSSCENGDDAGAVVNECLDFLLEQIYLLSARILTSNSHQAATSAIVATARSEVVVQTSIARRPDERRYSLASSPARHPRAGYGQQQASPVRRRRSSGVGLLVDVSPFEQLLQTLSLLLPEPDDVVRNGGGQHAESGDYGNMVNALSLHSTLTDRRSKADGVATNVQEAFEADTNAHLADGRRALWMTRESILAESGFGAVQLLDPEIDGSIAVMAQEVDNIRTRLGDVADKLAAARKGSEKRDKMVARWG